MDSRSQVATNPGANVRTLAKFAAAMMRKMAEFDYSKFELENTPDFQLRQLIGETDPSSYRPKCFSV